MRRLLAILLKAVTALSLALCAVILSQWVASYGDGGASLRLPFTGTYEVRSTKGQATLYRWDWTIRISPSATPVASIPLWALAAITIVLPLAHLREWRTDWQSRRRQRGWRTCLHCGYDLRESPTRCPECATLVGMPPLPPPENPVEQELLAYFEDAVAIGLADLTPDILGPPVARFLSCVKTHPEAHDYAERLIFAALAAPHAAERVLQLCLHALRWPAVRSHLKNRRLTERNPDDERLWGRLLDASHAGWPVAEHYRPHMAEPLAEK